MEYLMAQLADDLVDRIRKRLDITKTSKNSVSFTLRSSTINYMDIF